MRYLEHENAEALFQTHAKAYSLSLLEPTKAANTLAFTDWNNVFGLVNGHVHFTDDDYQQPGTFFGTWIPRSSDAHLTIYAGIPSAAMKADKNAPVSVCAVLDDRTDRRTDKYEQEWNALWQFTNVMQFSERFVAVGTTGLDAHAYAALPHEQTGTAAEDKAPDRRDDTGWAAIREMLFDDSVIDLADALAERNIPAPDEAGYELADTSGEVIAEIEMVWLHKHVGFMTEEQIFDRSKAEAVGWKICTNADEISDALKEE